MATFASVPSNGSAGLDYAHVTNKPIRGATVQLIDGSGNVVGTTTTDGAGNYSIACVNSSASSLKLRVRAELLDANHNFTVRDNTAGNALYTMDSAAFTPTAGPNTVNVNAPSGWGGTSYTGARVAGPFAILDVAYMVKAKLASVAPNASLPALSLYWSINNRPVSGNLSQGQIVSSHFTQDATGNPVIYLLGAENTDTDEYDTPVVAHEIGHYVQYAFSRNDTVGGAHANDQKLEMRLAFSEGWGNAWSSMVREDPVYGDTSGVGQASGFGYSLNATPVTQGWYSEGTIEYLLWQSYKDAAIGFQPIYIALANLRRTAGFSSIYSFNYYLEQAAPAAQATIVARAAAVGVNGTGLYGSGEFNDGGTSGTLPVYRDHTASLGTPATYCISSPNGTYNKLANYVYVKFTASGTRTFTITRAGATTDVTYPDLYMVDSAGNVAFMYASTPNFGSITVNLPTGTHVMAIGDTNLTTISAAPRCFDVKID